MARQDLITCLKNALERGYDIEKAKKSLTNAGYNPEEVNEATMQISNLNVSRLSVPKTGFFPKLPKPPKR